MNPKDSELKRSAWDTLRKRFKNPPSAWPTLSLLGIDLSLLAGALTTLTLGPVGHGVSVLLLGVVMLHAYLLHHECVHQSAFGRPWLNTALGHALGFFLLYPFLPRRRAHLLHHAWTGHAHEDPTN